MRLKNISQVTSGCIKEGVTTMLEITFKNGDYRSYSKDEYTDYRYYNNVFVVIKGSQWIGIYSMNEVRMIEFRGE